MIVSSTQAESDRQPLERQGARPRPNPSPRNLPGSLRAAFLGGLLAALAAGPALAQTAPTFLSNTGGTATSGVLHVGSTARTEQAVRFATSGAGAYLLSSVSVSIKQVSSGASLTVQLRHSAGDATATTPGDVVATFTGPATLGTGIQTFTAPPNTYVGGYGTYWISFATPSSADDVRLGPNSSTGSHADTGSASGWSIHGRSYKDNSSQTTWRPISTASSFLHPRVVFRGHQVALKNTTATALVATRTVGGSARTERAIRFSIGNQRLGYALAAVAFDIASVSSGASLTVQLRFAMATTAGNNVPGDLVATFTSPATLGTGLQTFTAPPGLVVGPYGVYWLTLSTPSSSDTVQVKFNNPVASHADAGGVAGWSFHGESSKTTAAPAWTNASDTATDIVNHLRTLIMAPPRTASTLVSTTGQTAGSTTSGGAANKAQVFRTGSNPYGYALDSIDVVSADGETFAVALYTTNSSGYPNTVMTNLSAPGSFAAGTLTFTAPAGGIRVAASTDYAVVFSSTSTNLELGLTSSHAEDSGAAAGWSVANRRFTINNVNAWGVDSDEPYRIAVKGVLNPRTATAPAAPAAPAVAAVSGSSTSLAVSWSAPADGGSAITGYDLRYRQGTSGDFTNGPQDVAGTSATITGLAANTLHQVQVRATNNEGDSAWSASGSGTTNAALTAPGAPAGLSATADGRIEIDLSWTAPASDGGSAITGYKIEWSATGSDPWTVLVASTGSAGTTYSDTGFSPGTTRHYRVSAINAIGTSGTSNTASATTEANNAPVFDPVTVSRAVAENTAAGQSVGAAVTATDADTGDTLAYTLGGTDAAAFEIVSSTGQIQTRTGVTYDHEAKASYAVTVTASDGTDTADATVTISVTDVDEPPAAPAAPGVAAVAGSTTSLTVSWSAPPNAGKPAIASYDLQYRQGTSGDFTNGPQDVGGTSATITGLTQNTLYQVQVRTTNAEGDSGWSASGSGTTNAGTTNNAPVFNPSAVSRAVAENTAAGQNVGAAVTATDADAGDTLAYTIGGADAAAFGIVSSTGQIQTNTGVTYDHEAKASYTVTVTASDSMDSATATVTISVTDVDEPPAAPDAPAVAGISGSTTSLMVSWTAPGNIGKPAIATYDVQYRQGTTGAFTNGPQDVGGTSATITGLAANTLYQVQVRATNAEGDSDWSPSGSGTTGTTATAPAAPTAPTVAGVSGSTRLAVSWSAPADNGSAITSYDLQYRQGTSGNFADGPQNVNGTSVTITGLAANSPYQVQVRATNAEGDSGWSASGSGTTNAATIDTDLVVIGFRGVSAPEGVVGQLSFPEDVGTAVLTAYLDRSPETALSVPWFTSDHTAVSPDDYTGGAGTLTFAPGEIEQTIALPIVDDAIRDEPDPVFGEDESFLVALEFGDDYRLKNSGAVFVLILDNDGDGPVTGDTRPPLLTQATVNGSTLVLTYNEALDGGSVPAAGAFVVTADGSAITVNGVSVAGSTVILTLATAVEANQAVTLAYTPGANPIQDTTGADAATLPAQAATNNTGGVTDVTPPLLTGAAVSGSTLVLTYNETLDGASIPDPGDFSVTAAGSPITVTGVRVAGSTVSLTLATAVEANQAVTLAYNTPGTNPIQDTAGNDAAPLSGQTVTHNTGGGGGGGGDGTSQTVPGAPTNLVAEATDGAVTLRWDAPEEDGGTPITDYEYRINGAGDWISTGSTETTYTVTGLDNDTEYTFEVRAVNRIGRSQAPPEPAEVTPRAAVALDFAHFANGAGTTSEVVLVNVAPYPIRPAIYFYDQEGEPIAVRSVVDLTQDLEILEDGALSVRTAMEPLGALTISTHGRENLRSGSVTVVAAGPIGGVLRYSVPEIGVAGVGASPPLSDAIFPARRQAGGINTGVAIRNQGEAALVVQCRLMQDGAVLEAMDIPLKANGQDARFIEQVFPATDTSDFAGSVRCAAPGAGRFTAIAAEMDAAGGIFTTLPVVEVNRGRAEATTLDFAHFANGTWVTDLVFVNLETRPSGPPLTPFHTAILPSRPAIYFYDTEGNPIAPELLVDITGDLEVTEDGALTVRTEMEPLGVLTISTHGRGEIVSGSVRVVSEGPIGGMLRFDHPDLGVAGMGSSRPVNDAIFPVRRQDGGITTGVAIHNLESSPELVRCELRKAGALLDAASIPLEANGQTAWLIDQTFTGTDTPNFSGSVRCSSPGEGLFTVVALELDAGNRIFTTLPVVPVVEVP